MAVNISLVEKNGRELPLGRFNEGKKTQEQVALACARKYKNLIGKLGCGDWFLRIAKQPPIDIPVENIKQDI